MAKGSWSARFLDDLIDNLPHYIFWKDAGGRFAGCNKRFAQQFGFKNVKEIIGKTDDDFPWEAHKRSKHASDDQEVLSQGVSKLGYEDYQKQLDGSYKTVLVSKVPIRDEQSEICGVLGIYTDITDRKQAEEELRKAKSKAETSSIAKTRFIANMEHDLRTPCAGLSEMSKILEARETDPEKKELLGYMAKASGQLLEILNSVLDLDRVETGKLPLVEKLFDIRHVLDSVHAMQKFPAIQKNIDLMIDCKHNVPSQLLGDEHRVSRILLNLVGNAVKFTDRGYVRVVVDLAREPKNHAVVLRLVVEDTGMGIPEYQQGHIFEKFAKLLPSNTSSFQGTGLGLGIVKRFTEDLGGTVTLKSDVGLGTSIQCLLPFALPRNANKNQEQNERAVQKIHPQAQLKILLVEDDKLAQSIGLVLIKENLSHKLDIAKTGQSALHYMTKNKYDLILMDIGLPDMNGYSVTRKVRDMEDSKNKETVIVALTAHEAGMVRKECLAAGMNDCLIKPISFEKLYSVIEKWLYKIANPSTENQPIDAINEAHDLVVDLAQGAKAVGGDEKLAREMLHLLIQELKKDRVEMKKSFDDNDMDRLSDIAHRVHGGTHYCGVPRLKKASRQLERVAAKSPIDVDGLTTAYHQLNKEIDLVMQSSV
jgi:two-component system, OmpR family, aerobic respiration control sensor histidine kinase ArcB